MRNKLITCLFAGVFCIPFSTVFAQEKFLLVVDVQGAFYEKTGLEIQANEMVRNINQLIGKIEPEKVIYIKAAGEALSISWKGLKRTVLPAPELDSRLAIVSGNMYTKTTGNSFALEALTEFLKKHGAKEIILVGLLAESCIYNTAMGGKERGYRMYVVPEAILGKSEKSKTRILEKMKKEGIETLPLADILPAP